MKALQHNTHRKFFAWWGTATKREQATIWLTALTFITGVSAVSIVLLADAIYGQEAKTNMAVGLSIGLMIAPFLVLGFASLVVNFPLALSACVSAYRSGRPWWPAGAAFAINLFLFAGTIVLIALTES